MSAATRWSDLSRN